MAISSICQTKVVSIDKNATLADVSEVMEKRHVGSVVVTESRNGKVIPDGIITDRDVALAMSSSPKPQSLLVTQIMQSHPTTVKKSDGIYETTVKMHKNGIKRIPVVNEDGSLFGIVSAEDLMKLLADEITQLAEIGETRVKREKGEILPVERKVRAQ